MATKTVPVMEVWCYPLIPQKRWTARSFGLSDHLANLQRGPEPRGGYTGFLGAASDGLTPTVGPGQGGYITEAEGLEWLNIWDEQDMTRLSGYTVAPRYVPLSNMIYGEDKLNPPTDTIGLVWQPTDGNGDYWQTCLPDREPLCTAIKFGAVGMEYQASAQTEKPLPQNQQFRLELQLLGVAKSAEAALQPWLRLTWGNSFCVYLVAGQEAVLGQLKSPSGNGAYSGDDLRALRALPYLGGVWDYQPVTLDVRYVGGRLVLQGAGQDTVYTDRQRNENPAKAKYDGEGQVSPVVARQAPLQVETQGVAFTLRVLEIAHADMEIGQQNPNTGRLALRAANGSGHFKRRFYATQSPKGAAAYAIGYDATMKAGSQGMSPERVGQVAIETGELNEPSYYTCTLNAKIPKNQAVVSSSWRADVLTYADRAMQGHSAPFVHAVTVKQPTTWRQISTADPVNVAPAVLNANETMADPLIQPGGPIWDFEVDRNILPDIGSPAGGALGNDWDDYVNKYHAIAVNVGWMYDDGVQRAWLTPTQASTDGRAARLYGYQMGIAPEAPQYGRRGMQLIARDPTVRLQKPAAAIDARFAALDFLIANKMISARSTEAAKVYGADAVQYILDTSLGPEHGTNLQVYYPGYTGHWPPAAGSKPNQWAMLDYTLYTDPPSGNGLMFPPPFGASALEWIGKIGQTDFAIFFYGRDAEQPRNLAPCYGNYFVYLQGRPTTRITDAVYLPGDKNLAAQGIGWRQVTDQDFNRFIVWGQVPGGGDLGGLMPALPQFSGEYTIEGSALPEQDASKTWERTKIMQGTEFWMPGVARMVARLSGWLVHSLQVRSVWLKTRGIEWLWWGDKVQVTTAGVETDPQTVFLRPDLSLQTFRVMRIHNRYDLEHSTWDATHNVADQPVYTV